MNRNLTERERIFANYTFDSGLISRIYKNSKIQRVNQTNSTITKWAMDMKNVFSKQEIQMNKEHLKLFNIQIN